MTTIDQLYQLVSQIRSELEARTADAKIGPKQVATITGLSDISHNLGVISAGEFLALSNGEDPQEDNAIGTFISAIGRVFNNKTYHIGGVNLGDLKWGVNSETGELEAGDGTVAINTNGISVYNDSPAEVARIGNLNGFLDYVTDTYGIAIGDDSHYMTYDYINGVRVYGALVSNRFALTENKTYYVRTYGSDSNDGIDGSEEHAFLTIQGAINRLADTTDTRNYDIILSLGAGTYSITEQIDLKNIVGGGSFRLVGDIAAPGNVVIESTVSGLSSSRMSTPFYISGIKMVHTGAASGTAISASDGAIISVSNVEFGNGWATHLEASDGGEITISNAYTISGGAGTHLLARGQGRIISSADVTIENSPAFTTFAVASGLGCIQAGLSTYTGTATGSRYQTTLNSIIDTASGGANFFPGDSAGTSATGGLYV